MFEELDYVPLPQISVLKPQSYLVTAMETGAFKEVIKVK